MLARLQTAATARGVSVETYLNELAIADIEKQSIATRMAAANSIRKLAAEINCKISVEELIEMKHAGHKY